MQSRVDILHLRNMPTICLIKKYCSQKAVYFLLFFLFANGVIKGQDSLHAIDVNKIKFSAFISDNMVSGFMPAKTPIEQLPDSLLKPGFINFGRIPVKMVDKKSVLRFKLTNSADSMIAVYFFPGHNYTTYYLYAFRNGHYEPLPVMMPPIKDSIGYRLIKVPPHDSLTIAGELFFEKTYTNYLRPKLIEEDYLDKFIGDMRHSREDLDIMTYIFCGILLMMIFFSVASFLMNKAKEFMYYSGYAFFLGSMLFTKSIFNAGANKMAFFLESYLDFILQSTGVIFYMLFMKIFLDTRKQFRFLQVFYNFGIGFLLIAIALYSYLHFFTTGYVPEYNVETITKYFLLAMVVIFIGYGIRHWDQKLLRFLVWGNLALFVFSLFSQLMITFKIRFPSLPVIFNASLFYYEMGLIIELILFLMGLNYKNRQQIIRQTKERERLRIENQVKEAEKKLAVFKAQQEERNRISLDMHDELGAGMTAIRLMSEIARKKMMGNVPKEIDRISHSANDLLNKMNAIIWSMNSRNDTVDNLVSYIRTYALEYFENSSIIVKISTPDNIPDAELTGDKRRNIFLCVKETLNNVVKHSNATLAHITVECEDMLEIKIHDDGVGIDLQNIRQFGNGLQNISRRMNNIGGSFKIENNHGTLTTFTLPLHC